MRLLTAITLIATLLGCISLEPPSDEEIARNRAAWETEQAEDRVRGRALWEQTLAEHGGGTFTVYVRSGSRFVERDIELEENRYCRVLVAERHPERHNDYWRNYDDYNALQRRCAGYEGIARIEPGDARPNR
ncbi:MAG: hypothetical protein NW203_04215 [Hyphomonadaceae bacterium]|nr:hypothetical protein [Hyphomonadaceae bacterium]